jgi:hypothetical protein
VKDLGCKVWVAGCEDYIGVRPPRLDLEGPWLRVPGVSLFRVSGFG